MVEMGMVTVSQMGLIDHMAHTTSSLSTHRIVPGEWWAQGGMFVKLTNPPEELTPTN